MLSCTSFNKYKTLPLKCLLLTNYIFDDFYLFYDFWPVCYSIYRKN